MGRDLERTVKIVATAASIVLTLDAFVRREESLIATFLRYAR